MSFLASFDYSFDLRDEATRASVDRSYDTFEHIRDFLRSRGFRGFAVYFVLGGLPSFHVSVDPGSFPRGVSYDAVRNLVELVLDTPSLSSDDLDWLVATTFNLPASC